MSETTMQILGVFLIAMSVWDFTSRYYRDKVKSLTAENEALKGKKEEK